MKKSTKQLLSAVLVIAMMATLLVVPTAAAGAKEVDVWDFGAEQLADTAEYKFNNHLTPEVINKWYDGMLDKDGNPVAVTPGASSITFPSTGFTDAAGLSYTPAGAFNHRLRTVNTALTRYDDKTMTGDGKDPYAAPAEGAEGVVYNGYIYSNSAKNTGVYFALDCVSGDKVTAVVSSNGTDSLVEFAPVDAEGNTGKAEGSYVQNLGSSSKGMTMTFYASQTGTYRIYSVTEKLTLARLYREHADEATLSGTIAEPAGMPAGYSVLLTSKQTGAQIELPVVDGKYSGAVKVPFDYEVTLKGANGYAITQGREVSVSADMTHDIKVKAIERVTLSGQIYGLDADTLATLGNDLLFTPTGADVVYTPEVEVKADGSYTALVEKNMPTDISALHINDYEIVYTVANDTKSTTVTGVKFAADTELDIAFDAKATHKVTIVPEGVALAKLANAKFTFTNLAEAGATEDQLLVPYNPVSDTNLTGYIYNYVYTFTGTDAIALRDGTYDVKVETSAGKQKVTSNLVVKGADVSKTIRFTPAADTVAPGVHDFTPTTASLDDVDGMEGNFTPHGSGHGLVHNGAGGEITLKLAEPSNITITGCQYSAKGDDGVIVAPTSSKGTVVADNAPADPVYTISGVDGEVTLSFSATTYIHSIKVEPGNPATVEAGEHDLAKLAPADQTAYVNGIKGLEFSKFGTNNGHGIEWKANSDLTLNLSDAAKITLTTCTYNGAGTKVVEGMTVTEGTGEVVMTTYEESEGKTAYIFTVTAEAGTLKLHVADKVYVHKLAVEYDTLVMVPDEWNFRSGSSIMGKENGKKVQNAVDTVESLAIDATATNAEGKNIAKFDSTRDDWAQVNEGTVISVPIYGAVKDGEKITLTVNCYSAGKFTVGGTANTKAQENEDFECVVENGAVKIVATANDYLGYIKVNYAEGVLPAPAGDIVLKVGADKEYKTINAAVTAAESLKREPGQRIVIEIDPGDYEEQLYIKVANLTLRNAKAAEAKLALTDKGAKIGANEVRITWYYGHGYTYYSMTNGHRYDADVLAVNKENGYPSYINAGSGSTDDSYWNASVLLAADGFQAEGIIFENSFNQYVSAKSVEDKIEAQSSAREEAAKPRAEMKTVGDTTVQNKSYVERAGAVSIKSGTNIFFDHCAFVGRQDVLYGPEGSKVALYDCDVYGGTDYIYGGMTLVAAKCDLVLNTSEDKNDVSYITAGQQKTQPGYLMWNCTVTSTTPGVNTASQYRSKPGYFGRPWQGATGEALFYATNIENTDPIYYDDYGYSLIRPEGWNSSLGGESAKSAELESVEFFEGLDNTANRVAWASVPTAAPTVAGFLGDWDPLAGKDMTIVKQAQQPLPVADVDTAALADAVKAAKAVYATTQDTTYAVMPDTTLASSVTKGTKYVLQSDVDALAKAIADAEAVLANKDATQEQVDAAVAAVNEAVKTFNAAIKTGTKTSGGSGGGYNPGSSSSGSSSTTTANYTKTDANGNTAKKTTDRNGNVTITVTDKNGEVVAKVELPATIPALAKKFKDVPDDHWAAKSINDLAALGMVKGVADEIYDMNSPVTRGSLATILFRLAQAKGAVSTFSDVSADAWYADAVGWAAKVGVVNGNGDGTFAADASITREQLATMLYRFAQLLGADTRATGKLADFADGEAVSDWAQEAMVWAVGAGILQGNTAKELMPANAASRAETACMVDRFISLLK